MLSILSVVVLFLLAQWNGNAQQTFFSTYNNLNSCGALTLIHAVPSSQNEEQSGWNVSEVDLLYKTGNLAVDSINNLTSILPGVTLDVVHVSTEDCVREPPLQDFVEIFKEIQRRRCVLGIVGLYCSSVTRKVAELWDHPKFGYIQLSSSTSPLFQNLTKYPYLYRFISSSMMFNQAIIKMMDEFNWKRISLIYDFSNIFFKTTGKNFAEEVKKRKDLNLTSILPLITSANHGILENIQRESRINYFSVTHKESTEVLCEAYYQNFTWPKYVHIFVDESLDDILANVEECSKDQLLQGAEGAFLLLNRLSNSNDTERMDSHHDQYKVDLESLQNQYNGEMKNYSNILYDQIWAFAFAANKSLAQIKTITDGSFEDYIKHSSIIRNILYRELQNIMFPGVSGTIKFNKQEVLTIIDIYQVQNGSQTPVGVYNPFVNKLSLINYFDKEIIPEDSFEVRQDAIPIWLGLLVAVSQGVLLVVFVLTFVSLILWRNVPEIKSTSVQVSILILGGCLIVMLSSFFYNLENFADASMTSISTFCNLESCFFLSGINIIVVSLLFRLLRVFIIFHNKAKTGILKDAHLFLYISLTSVPSLIILVLWTGLDHLRQTSRKIFISGKDPHFSEHFHCSSHHTAVWMGLYYGWMSVLLVPLLVLAIQTRHVQYSDFKDTKKMSAFIFVLTFSLGSLLPLPYLLQSDLPVGAYILKSLLTFLIPLACLTFQYIPKLFPILCRKKLPCMANYLSS